MRQLMKHLDEIVGQTVVSYGGSEFQEYIALHCNNGTSLVLNHSASGDGDSYFELITHYVELDLYVQRDLKLITQDEYDAVNNEEQRRRLAEEEARERSHYERLRKRFGQPESTNAVDPRAQLSGTPTPRETGS